jgi:HNH endonuclease
MPAVEPEIGHDGYLWLNLNPRIRYDRWLWSAMTGADVPASHFIEHVNGERHDSRPSNLRLAAKLRPNPSPRG